jgi:hypothetical protein
MVNPAHVILIYPVIFQPVLAVPIPLYGSALFTPELPTLTLQYVTRRAPDLTDSIAREERGKRRSKQQHPWWLNRIAQSFRGHLRQDIRGAKNDLVLRPVHQVDGHANSAIMTAKAGYPDKLGNVD